MSSATSLEEDNVVVGSSDVLKDQVKSEKTQPKQDSTVKTHREQSTSESKTEETTKHMKEPHKEGFQSTDNSKEKTQEATSISSKNGEDKNEPAFSQLVVEEVDSGRRDLPGGSKPSTRIILLNRGADYTGAEALLPRLKRFNRGNAPVGIKGKI